jgi:hypothetical protein
MLAIEKFSDLYKNFYGRKVLIFHDFIIKLTIHRAYAMKKNKSIITADKLLHLADQGIKKYDLESQGDLMVERNG